MIARDAIAELDGSRVTAFVPLLALRGARETLASLRTDVRPPE